MSVKDRDAYNAYMREYMQRRYLEKRRRWLALLGGQCVLCGSRDDLQIDHKEARLKSFDISSGFSRAETRTLDELKKCQVLCRSCHIAKHATAKGTHGTLSAFRHCKCAECRSAKASYMKEYGKRRRASSSGKAASS